MLESTILIIFIISLGGVALILARKIPHLVELNLKSGSSLQKNILILGVQNRVKDFFIFFEKQLLTYKVLSWSKIAILKIETHIDALLHKARAKAQQKSRNSKK